MGPGVITRRVVSVIITAGLVTSTATALADQPLDRTPDGYPSRPLMVMAPANPGGGWDQTSRVIQHVLVTRRIVPVSVEVFNRGGAGGTIGLAELVGRHRRDPHVVMTAGAVMMGAIAAHRSPFTMKDTVPIARLINEYEAVAIPSSSPYQSLRDLLAAWKAAPRSITWAGGSAGGLDHILVGQLARSLGIASEDVRYIAFAGGGEAAAAVMGGQVTAGMSGYGEWKGLADTGRMRMLATSSPARIGADGPPTFHEQGVDLTVANWRCVLAPPGTSPSARAWLVDALRQMRGTAEWQAYLKNNYWEDSFLDGPEFERFLDRRDGGDEKRAGVDQSRRGGTRIRCSRTLGVSVSRTGPSGAGLDRLYCAAPGRRPTARPRSRSGLCSPRPRCSRRTQRRSSAPASWRPPRCS